MGQASKIESRWRPYRVVGLASGAVAGFQLAFSFPRSCLSGMMPSNPIGTPWWPRQTDPAPSIGDERDGQSFLDGPRGSGATRTRGIQFQPHPTEAKAAMTLELALHLARPE